MDPLTLVVAAALGLIVLHSAYKRVKGNNFLYKLYYGRVYREEMKELWATSAKEQARVDFALYKAEEAKVAVAAKAAKAEPAPPPPQASAPQVPATAVPATS